MAEEEEGQRSHPSVPQSSAADPPPPPPSQAVGTSSLGSSQLSSAGGHGQGLYAVQFSPLMGMMPEYPSSVLIPLTYKIPTRTNSTGTAGEEQGQGGEAARQQHGPQRQVVVRRFQLAFQLDLALLLKLAFAVFLFGQDGSRQRTIVLVLLASLIYLYQTGVLTPLIRYARQGLAPPRPPVRPQNAAAARPNDQQPDNAGGNENQEQPAEGSNPPQPQPEQPEAEQEREREQRANGINLWGIAREIQTFIVGFITSLLPGFEQRPHND